MLFICTNLLSVLDLFLCLLTIAISFCAFVVTQRFCPVFIKHHALDLESVCFDSKHLHITLDMFYILFIVIVDSWNVNKISISIYGLDHHGSNISVTITITGKVYVLEQVINTYHSYPVGIKGGLFRGIKWWFGFFWQCFQKIAVTYPMPVTGCFFSTFCFISFSPLFFLYWNNCIYQCTFSLVPMPHSQYPDTDWPPIMYDLFLLPPSSV